MSSVSVWTILAVGTGGFIGAVTRYLISLFTLSSWDMNSLPLGTITVNLLGCFAIGILAGIFQLKDWTDPGLRLFLFVGVLGGFTTFSTFSNESLMLWKAGELNLAGLNILIQVIGGLILVWLGYYTSKWAG